MHSTTITLHHANGRSTILTLQEHLTRITVSTDSNSNIGLDIQRLAAHSSTPTPSPSNTTPSASPSPPPKPIKRVRFADDSPTEEILGKKIKIKLEPSPSPSNNPPTTITPLRHSPPINRGPSPRPITHRPRASITKRDPKPHSDSGYGPIIHRGGLPGGSVELTEERLDEAVDKLNKMKKRGLKEWGERPEWQGGGEEVGGMGWDGMG